MDGTPEFIVGGATEGTIMNSTFYIYYLENGKMKLMQGDYDKALYFGSADRKGGHDNFPLTLLQSRGDGSFAYISDETSKITEGQYDRTLRSYNVIDKNNNKLFSNGCAIFLSAQKMYSGKNFSIAGLTGSGNGGVEVTKEEFFDTYNTFFNEAKMYKTLVKAIPCSKLSSDMDNCYDKMSIDEKLNALNDSYKAWSYTESSDNHFPLQDVIDSIKIQPTTAASNAYKQAYKDLITSLSQNTNITNQFVFDYALYDMNQDSVPELIVKSGTCEGDYKLSFYTYKNSEAICVSDNFNGGHSNFYIDQSSNQFCKQYAQMGGGKIEWYSFDGNTVTISNSVDNIQYATVEDIDAAFAPYGNFSRLETAYCYYRTDGWHTSSETQEVSGIDTSIIDNY
ncbi:MAG: hypothetical protein LKG21_08635 [Ruminococcus sp.]|nr:hypothetical protein [Ruminococcus sp.]